MFANILRGKDYVVPAKSLAQVLKANPYHDENGRFASKNGGIGKTPKIPTQDELMALANPKGSLAAYKSWQTRNRNKAIKTLHAKYEQWRDELDAVDKLNNDEATDKALAAFNAKVKKLRETYEANGGSTDDWIKERQKALENYNIKKDKAKEESSLETIPETPLSDLKVKTKETSASDPGKAAEASKDAPKPKVETAQEKLAAFKDQYFALKESQKKSVESGTDVLVAAENLNNELSKLKEGYLKSGGTLSAWKAQHELHKLAWMDKKAADNQKLTDAANKAKEEEQAKNSDVPKFKLSEAKDKGFATFQNHDLGMHYYKMADTKGKEHPDTQAAYAEWQKAKDSLKAFGITDTATISKSIKDAYLAKKKKETDEANAKKVAETLAAKKAVEAELKNNVYSMMHQMYNGADKAAQDDAGAKLGISVKKAKELGYSSEEVADLFAAGTKKAKEDTAKAEQAKTIIADEAKKIAPKASDVNVKDVKNGTEALAYYAKNGAKFSDVSITNKMETFDFEQHQKAQVAALTPQEKAAIGDYTGSGYQGVNKEKSTYASSIENLSKAMAKSTLGADIKLRRNMAQKWFWQSMGVSEAMMDKLTPEELKQYVGRTYTEKAFSSTSKDLSFGSNYTDTAKQSGVLSMNIRAHKGIRGIDVSSISNHTSEKEVVLDRGVTYIVTNITKKTSGKGYDVDVDAIGHMDIK